MKALYFNYIYDTKYSSVGPAVHVKEFASAFAKMGDNIKTLYQNSYVDDGEKKKPNFRDLM